MLIQITLTSPASKRIIAKGVKALDWVRDVREKGKIVLKGGTTVSAVSEELCGRAMQISGMITPKGTLTSRYPQTAELHHGMILHGDQIIAIATEEDWAKETRQLTPQDLVITGANAFDIHGHAAIMAGSYAGGRTLPSFQPMLIEGIPFLIAAGLEKLVPGNLWEVIPLAGRKRIDFSYGMSVGLIPVFGKIFTEVDAIETLAAVKARVIGKGGIHGAEGSTTLLIEGPETEVLKIDEIYQGVRGAELSGDPRNLTPCVRGCPSCKSKVLQSR